MLMLADNVKTVYALPIADAARPPRGTGRFFIARPTSGRRSLEEQAELP